MKSFKLFGCAFLFCQFLFHISFAQTGKVDSTSMITLRIDPQSARGAKVSQIFDEVKFIPLETTKESIFGRINMLKVIKDYFLVFDYNTKSVLIFQENGKYKTKIDASKITQEKGDKSKASFYGFTTEEIKKQRLIKIYTEKYCYYFDLDGKLVNKILSKNANYNNDLKYADSSTVVRQHYLYKKDKDSTSYEIGVFNKKKDSIGYFPFSIKRYETDEFWSSGSRVYDYGVPNELFYLNYYDYNLYKVTPSKLSLAYRIIFPANNSLPRDFGTNPIYVKKRGEYFQKNPRVFYGLSNTYLFGNHLYLKMNNYGYEPDLKKAIIYHLKSGEVTSIADIEPDERSSFLPITDASGNFNDFRNYGFHLFQDGYLYTSYSSLAMFSFKEQLSDKFTGFSKEMIEYFKTQDKKGNPVLIRLKPKKD
jgi:hypothetical protein